MTAAATAIPVAFDVKLATVIPAIWRVKRRMLRVRRTA